MTLRPRAAAGRGRARRWVWRGATILVGVVAAPREAAAQPHAAPPHAASHHPVVAGKPTESAAVARFVAEARDATARFRDPAAATVAGYRQIGPEFPGMGTHWIHLGLLFGNALDPRRPAVLEYATVGGAPRLVGVAYLLPLVGDERPPSFPAPGVWHDHTGSVDEESALLDHAMAGSTGGGRIAMLHAWLWLDNPAGTFTTDNWALPFVRAGLPAPAAPPPRAAARALSLVSGGDAYYAALYSSLARLDAADSAAIGAAFADARAAVGHWQQARPRGAAATPADLAALAAVWERAWTRIERGVTPAVRARLWPAAAP